MNETRSFQAPPMASRPMSTLSVPEPQDKPTVAPDGLSDEDVHQRQQQYGLNEIPEKNERRNKRALLASKPDREPNPTKRRMSENRGTDPGFRQSVWHDGQRQASASGLPAIRAKA
jgi:hypothetical protein